MKHLLLVCLAAATAAGAFAVDGDSFEWQGFVYTVLSETDHTCEVGENSAAAKGDVTIPSVVERDGVEYTVTALGRNAFYANIDMTSISIPPTVTAIRYQALSRCIGLTELTLPNSVTEVESRGVYACNYLEHLTLSSGLRELNREAFSGCPYLEEIVIPDGVVTIHEEAFNYCARATRLSLPSSVTSIGKMAFAGCAAIEGVTIPGSVASIGEEAFGYCPSIASVTLAKGSGKLTFGINAFGNPAYAHEGDVVSKIVDLRIDREFECESADMSASPFTRKPTLRNITVGAGVEALPSAAFGGCEGVTLVRVERAACPSATSDCFAESVYGSATLEVPEESLDAYRANSVWGRFATVRGFEAEPEHPEQPWILTEENVTLTEGTTRRLLLSAVEEGYEPEYTVAWSSTDASVAAVDNDGLISAVAPGTVEIMARVEVAGKVPYTLSCAVTVTPDNSGITAVGTDTVADNATLYDLSGRSVGADVAAGLYIQRRSDGSTVKIIIR